MTCDDVRFLCRSIGGVERWNGCALENEGDCRVGARRRHRAVPRPGTYGPRPSRRASSARVFRFTSVRRHASIDWKHRVDESIRLGPSRRARVGMTARAHSLALAFSSPRRTSPPLVAGFPCVPVVRSVAITVGTRLRASSPPVSSSHDLLLARLPSRRVPGARVVVASRGSFVSCRFDGVLASTSDDSAMTCGPTAHES